MIKKWQCCLLCFVPMEVAHKNVIKNYFAEMNKKAYEC